MKQFTFLLVFIFALSACKSLDKLYEQGDYKGVLSKLDGKAKKGKLDRQERTLLLKSADKYTEEILGEIQNSLSAENPNDWIRARKQLGKLDKKLSEINDYSQIRSSEVIDSRMDELLPQLNDKLYNYSVNEYDIAIAEYEKTGDRDYAIKAYSHASKLVDYGGVPEEVAVMEDEAVKLGHRLIYVDLDGPVGKSFSFGTEFERNLDLDDDRFNTFTTFFNNDADYRLEVDVDIRWKDEDRSTSDERYTDRVVDYYEEEIDTSTNKTNKIPVYKDIEAVVERTEVLRYVEGSYSYEVYDLINNRRFDSGGRGHRVEEREVYFTLESGDEDAVPSRIELGEPNFIGDPFDEIIEELFRVLASEFNSDANIKNKLF